VIGVVADVTERRRAEEELRDSEARFRALTELSSDWYWRQDEELRFVYISHQVADEHPLDSVTGRTRWELPGVTPLSSNWAESAVLAARQPFRDFSVPASGRTAAKYVGVMERRFRPAGVPWLPGRGRIMSASAPRRLKRQLRFEAWQSAERTLQQHPGRFSATAKWRCAMPRKAAACIATSTAS
jgi:hypothetical protein